MMSDHSLIVASFGVTDNRPTQNTSVQRRRWRSFDYESFVADLEQSRLLTDPPSDVTELFDCYDKTLAELLDKHAPLHTVRIKARPSAPWLDAECRNMRAATRRLEKRYRRRPSTESRAAWQAQFREQRSLFQRKFVAHWSTAIDNCGGDYKALWSTLRPLLRPDSITASRLTADDHARYFAAKIDRIRASTAAAPPPRIVDRFIAEPLSDLRPATVEEVAAILGRSAAKQCELDPIPTWLVKRAGAVLAPVITGMCNASFQQVKLPDRSKMAIVRPLLKKSTLDPNDPGSYRPISNLSFVSKVVEKVVDTRISEHVAKHQLLPVFQSAYRPFHSTETAMVCIMNDLIGVLDHGDIGALMLLDLSAAFDTVDHSILMETLRRRFGVRGHALDWLADYLKDRSQVVRARGDTSEESTLQFGVPQGSILGPRKFIEYAEDASLELLRHRLRYHLYADDMQGHKHGKPAEVPTIVAAMEHCVADVGAWCASKRLQLNADKTEILWFGSAANLRKMPPDGGSLRVGQSVVEPVTVVRDLGVLVDSELSMRQHISRTTQMCFYHLRRLRSLRDRLGHDVTARLVSALVLSRLDYCNAVLAGLPATTLAPLQRVLHAAARLVLRLKPRDHVTAALRDLHWLPIAQRIEYKLCLLVHKVSIGHAPQYLMDMLTAAADVPSKAALRVSRSGDYVVPRTRLRFGDRAFSVAAPRAWNRLPAELKLTRNTTTFKRLLKTYLFRLS